MKNILLLLFIAFFFTSCITQKLVITNDKLPDKLGIHLINNAKIPDNDWKYFTSATDSFVNNYNSDSNAKFKLYSTSIDSNSIKIDIHENSYCTRSQQVLSVVVTSLGIVTPILLISAQAPIIFAFWYSPRNYTVLSKSLSSDLDKSNIVFNQIIETEHEFQSFEKQKVKQKKAYYDYLKGSVNEIKLGKRNLSYSDYPDNLTLNDGREFKCKVTNADAENIFFTTRSNDKIIETHVRKEKIKTIQRGVH